MTSFSAEKANKDANLDDLVKLKRKIASQQGELRSLRSENTKLIKQIDKFVESLDSYSAISSFSDTVSLKKDKRVNKEKTEATAVICFSDWHVGENVVKKKTNGLNSYSPAIAKYRAEQCSRNAVTLLKQNLQVADITHTIIWLGGDFITGYLHQELSETNAMGPVEEAYYAYELIAQSLSTISNSGAGGKITVVCNRGNHGRTTKKMQYKNDDQTSFESFIYWCLRDRFPELNWVINSSDITYLKISRKFILRFIHGHQIRYNGGVGGISVPLRKWIAKQQDSVHADFTVLGHFHQRQMGPDFLVNGSTKGYDEFAQSHGFSYEPPQQSFFLVDHEYNMVSTSNPIFS
jgi:hypothetical protein